MKASEREEAQEGEIVETHWDIKKIGIGLFVLAILFIFGSYLLKFLGNRASNTIQPREVLGISSEKTNSLTPTPALPSKDDIQNVISNAQNTLSSLTSDNLTSSQAAIQKVIDDLQALKGGNGGAVGTFCKLVCSDK